MNLTNEIFDIFLADLNVLKIPEDSIVTCDLRMDRVRVFYDKNGSVSSAPTIG